MTETTASEAQENQRPESPINHVEVPTPNGHAEHHDGERPFKRRRVSDGAPPPITRKKVESPPWKKAAAEGPSSFTENGIRKSARTNHVPLELQPPSDKRQTRGAMQRAVDTKASSKPGKMARKSKQYTPNDSSRRYSSSGIARKPPSTPTPSKRLPVRRSLPAPTSPSPPSKKKPAKKSSPAPPKEYRQGSRRSTRVSEAQTAVTNGFHTPEPEAQDEDAKSTPRIRFRVKPRTVHPEHVPRPKLFPTFEEYIQRASDILVSEGGLLDPDDTPRYTDEMAVREVQTMLQLEAAVQPGGALSQGVSSIYDPEPAEEPPRQYAHLDHMVRAAKEFRRLMILEQNKHRRNAKRLAEACRDEWIRRQPKTDEQIAAEALKANESRYRAVLKTLLGMWENVRVEVNKRRLAEWEEQEQIRVRKALNEAVDISTQKLEARMVQGDSEMPSDEDVTDVDDGGTDSSTEDSDSEDDSNISGSESESESEEDVRHDEELSVEELRRKYADLPENPPATIEGDSESDVESTAKDIVKQEDDSDESIDMDDDLGSSDEDMESDESDGDAAGLWGFLAPTERAAIMKDASEGAEESNDAETNGSETNEPETNGIDEDMAESAVEAVTNGTDHVLENDAEHDLTRSQRPTETDDSPPADTATSEDLNQPDVTMSEAPDMTADKLSETKKPSADTGAVESSSLTPVTSESKSTHAMTDPDSNSSVELNGRAATSSTPQPSNLKTPIPFLLRGTLREYQHYGLDWLARLYANNTNGILADEMGLGKTIQTIALLAHLACEHEVWGPHLVIVPTSVMLNWEMEFKKWCPGFKILTYYGTQEERKRKRQGWNQHDLWNVCITSYQLVLQDQQVFKRRKWHYMILDEAHNIKNFRSHRWQTLLTFNTRARLLLTGTPLQNNLTELWSLLFFLMPSDGQDESSGFADLKEFSDWFKKPQDQILEHGRETMDDEARAIISKLHKVLRPYLLRRIKADVEKQMPAKYEHVELCRMSRRQRELYDGFLNRADTRGTLSSGNYLSIINCLMQLRKVCNHPDLFQEREIVSSWVQRKSVIGGYEYHERTVRRRLLYREPMSIVSLEFLNMVPAKNEGLSTLSAERGAMLSAQRILSDMRDVQRNRAQYAISGMDSSTVHSNIAYLESASRWSRFEELQHVVYLNALRRQKRPIYGKNIRDLVTIRSDRWLFPVQPRRADQRLEWMLRSSTVLKNMIQDVSQRSEEMHPFIQRFACITPPVLAKDAMRTISTRRGAAYFQSAPDRFVRDPFHESRIRLSLQFPDKRLLQYDCGKLQALDRLLRKLQAGGHRALIFTQMTKVLDILEQFLNIHGHKYLRLDGSTKIEQRQILTDRFNNDTRILAFILSSRSGGLGINLTGADTVIFYDLDWNPAMDKQCQDRCHRIGQTRDVHIYRLVSEHTIEANILRKANQKRMLDDVVIQEGEFTTDYFNKMTYRDALDTTDNSRDLDEGEAAANAAVDRVLGGPSGETNPSMTKIMEQAEDQEDVAAAKIAQREVVQSDAMDFDERATKPAGLDTPLDDSATPVVADVDSLLLGDSLDDVELNAWGKPILHMDDYMLAFMTAQLQGTPLDLPKDKNARKKGREHRKRPR